MNRKLTVAMLLSLSATSPMALALGLGEAEVRSTLNAPLRASIPLTDTVGIQAGLLNVSVADENAYGAAGLARTPLAASVRLAVERRQGRLVVDLTTDRPVREPWLDLMLRFDWPGGQQLREVTLLLDPPNYDEMPVLVAGGSRGASTGTSAAPVDRESTRPVARPSSPSTPDDPAWVRSGDTLWAVAGRLRPDSGISMNQMMVALVEANPDAFPSGNINAMRAGFTLVVPGREAIAARPDAEAERLVAAMNQAWANRGGGAPARIPLDGGASDGETDVAVATAPAERVADVESSTAGAAPEEQGTAQAAEPTEGDEAPAGEEPAPRLTLLTDAEVAAEQALAEADTEGDGAAPRGGQGAGDEPRVNVDPELLEALHGGGGGELTSDERLLRLEDRWRESQAQLSEVQEERDRLQEEVSEMRDELAAMRDQLAALTAGGTGVDGPGAGGLVTADDATLEEAPWWGAFYPAELDRKLMLGGAGLAALLALWLAVRVRRRREEDAAGGFGEVRVATPGGESPVSPQRPSVPAAPRESVQSSLPQAEAINEADIFIAYGRYDQARELLEASLAREPERDDLRLKLLTVHLEQGSRDEAEREAARLRDGGNPAVAEEVERLLARHGLGAAGPVASEAPPAAPAGGTAEDRAIFTAAAKPPRRFDEEDEEAQGAATDSTRPEYAASSDSMPDEAPSGEPEPAADDAPPAPEPERFRRPGSAPAEAPPAEAGPAGEDEVPAMLSPGDDVPPSPEEADELPPVTTHRRDDGSEIIDYRPPSLDPAPAPREETPMQPSVDFTPSAAPDEPSERDEPPSSQRPLPDDWEVEEVAFPPLDPDNSAFASSASPDRLAEARRLVEAGEGGRARDLLNDLCQSDDPAVRDEATALLRRLDS